VSPLDPQTTLRQRLSNKLLVESRTTKRDTASQPFVPQPLWSATTATGSGNTSTNGAQRGLLSQRQEQLFRRGHGDEDISSMNRINMAVDGCRPSSSYGHDDIYEVHDGRDRSLSHSNNVPRYERQRDSTCDFADEYQVLADGGQSS